MQHRQPSHGCVHWFLRSNVLLLPALGGIEAVVGPPSHNLPFPVRSHCRYGGGKLTISSIVLCALIHP